jgi:peptidoglycan/LPS O-acetylase OafA/YrhL
MVELQINSGPRTSAQDASHLSALDALRGLAIVLVVIGHYLPQHVVGGSLGEALQPWGLGGVTLFFLLSGFLIGRNLSRGEALVGYALRRVFRILPAYWAAIVVLIVVHRFILGEADFGTFRDVVFNALLLQDVGRVPYLNLAFWTLLIEAKFYILAPLLVLGGGRFIKLAPYLVVAANGLILAHRGEASSLLTYLAFCFVGMNFELWHRNELSKRALITAVICTAIAAGIYSPYVKTGLIAFGLLNAALMTVGLRAGAWITLPSLSFIGAVSYSWYLFHGGLGYPLMAALEHSRYAISPLISACVGIVVTLFVAWLSYRLIEQPGISLGRMLEKRVSNRTLRAMPERS